jgi:hypothetical protein
MNKEEQKQLIVDIMNEDTKDGLYKQQTAVEWLAEKYNYITWMRNRDEISADTADEWCAKYLKQAKELEEQQIEDAIKNELKLIGNYFDVSKLETKEQGHHIRLTAILKDRFDYYNQTHGGNK